MEMFRFFHSTVLVHCFNLFPPNLAFHIETSHFIHKAKQMTIFYMKRNTGLKWVKNVEQHFSARYVVNAMVKATANGNKSESAK